MGSVAQEDTPGAGSTAVSVPEFPQIDLGRVERIMILCVGSRGDAQPYIAMGMGLKKAGFRVVLVTCKNHKKFGEEMGTEVEGLFGDSEEAMRSDPLVLQTMENGNTLEFFKAVNSRENVKKTQDVVPSYLEFVREYKPQLLLSGPLLTWFAGITRVLFRIPVINCKLAGVPGDGSRTPLGLPQLPFGLSGWFMSWLGSSMYKAECDFDRAVAEHTGGPLYDVYVTRENWIADQNLKAPEGEFDLYAVSERVAAITEPGCRRKQIATGAWILEGSVQAEAAKKGDGQGGGGAFGDSALLEELEAFIEKHKKEGVVYMGWGSMVSGSPLKMTRFAVDTVRLTGMAAVVLGGFARLSVDLLKESEEPGDKELAAWLEEGSGKGTILVPPKAPHEWLFPKCAAVVHHGGAGTTMASLRAGVPVVITPVFGDQYDHAHLVSELGVGIGTRQLQKISSAELASAIRQVTGDPEVRRKAAEIGEAERNEKGVEKAVAVLSSFVKEEVESGKWRQRFDAEHERLTANAAAKSQQSSSGWFSWLGWHLEAPQGYKLTYLNTFFHVQNLSQKDTKKNLLRSCTCPVYPVSVRFGLDGTRVPVDEGDPSFLQCLENIGSLHHRGGRACPIKRCYFAHTKKKCKKGWLCSHCHYCTPTEKDKQERAERYKRHQEESRARRRQQGVRRTHQQGTDQGGEGEEGNRNEPPSSSASGFNFQDASSSSSSSAPQTGNSSSSSSSSSSSAADRGSRPVSSGGNQNSSSSSRRKEEEVLEGEEDGDEESGGEFDQTEEDADSRVCGVIIVSPPPSPQGCEGMSASSDDGDSGCPLGLGRVPLVGTLEKVNPSEFSLPPSRLSPVRWHTPTASPATPVSPSAPASHRASPFDPPESNNSTAERGRERERNSTRVEATEKDAKARPSAPQRSREAGRRWGSVINFSWGRLGSASRSGEGGLCV
uniref:Uncharacterized protein n=1 Tax=Chromera velia CCMP2878 TaxID=1169474 RepID=A0A0G4IFZ7_9ALVE|eukprot:Cvel_14061.t1-p1 / transcript=Cvel_14061.t1 / gene=Cvel_14061 / organism=Chromera_velia_CCMP2878 / gene_product=Sterol 3-beta-glucosyltransferase, putative / transcript_product=Sterol 3-beta-glucosyltransferase, putative / location=Cvel_scaffold986:34588-39349(-) / protein_length=943 / sequence_SO=supercontig / SO=protein_coding / is_pseudo=false